MQLKGLCGIVFILAVLVNVPAFASSVTVNYVDGTTFETDLISQYDTTGDLMEGMEVKVYFVGGGSETLYWTKTGTISGGVSGATWSLSESGDTFKSEWKLTNTSRNRDLAIDYLIIDASKGMTTFDRKWNPEPGTANSAKGLQFYVDSDELYWNITATYYDRVALTGQAPVGDEYRHLKIDFTKSTGFRKGELYFMADTDNMVKLYIPGVPIPGAVWLLGSGLLGLLGLRRRFQP